MNPGAPPHAKTRNGAVEIPLANVAESAAARNDSSNKPLITLVGLCHGPKGRGANSECKTIITQGEFDRIIEAVQPGMPQHARREFAMNYIQALMLAQKATDLGLDKGPVYDEQMRLARTQILSRAARKFIQESTSEIPPADIQQYYARHLPRFEKAEVDRIFVPRGQGALEEARNLRARAAAGEDFAQLQLSAYQKAGIRAAVSSTAMFIRRISLPADETSVMDLKPGEISPVLADPNGYCVYRMKTRIILPLHQVEPEIMETLRSERLQDEMERIENSAGVVLDEKYFSR